MPMSRESSKSSGSPPSPEGDVQYKEKASIDGAEDAASNEALGYKQELTRNRSLFTLLFQSLAIAAIPYGEGSPLINAVYGGGQLSIFVGWIICNLLSECTACSLAELASRYPTAGGPSYWAHKISPRGKDLAAYMTGWVYLIGNWTITLRYVPISTNLAGHSRTYLSISVNFGFASLLSGTIAMYYQNFILNDWQLMLIFYGVCLFSLTICVFCNRWLPQIDSESRYDAWIGRRTDTP